MNRRELIFGGLSTHLSTTLLPNPSLEFMTMPQPKPREDREVIWRRVLDDLSFEQARLMQTAAKIDISGLVIAAHNGSPLRVDYWIECDPSWQTRTVRIHQTWDGNERQMQLDHDGHGHWQRDHKDDPTLAGCTDIDLGISPSTNALAINRLKLPIAHAGEIRAAWLTFPEFELKPSPQSYRRLAERQYEYRSLESGFTAVLKVDDDGLPVEYGNVWHRLAEGPALPNAASSGFTAALVSDGPSPELQDTADTFGWLIGGWTGSVQDFDPDGSIRTGEGEWWFSWVLEGRAIQDVLICPPRNKRPPNKTSSSLTAGDRYGTTVRRFDKNRNEWRITWINPVSGALNIMAGKRNGDQLILLGTNDGREMRWSFVDIRSQSFTWRGEERADGKWKLSSEFKLHRVA
jgi:hypothetical protein